MSERIACPDCTGTGLIWGIGNQYDCERCGGTGGGHGPAIEPDPPTPEERLAEALGRISGFASVYYDSRVVEIMTALRDMIAGRDAEFDRYLAALTTLDNRVALLERRIAAVEAGR